MVIHEKEIIGIRGSTRKELAHVIKLVEEGVLRPYIYRTYPLSQINEALEQMRKGNAMGRTAVLPWQEEEA